MSRVLIGITGGIGSGKSAVTEYLRQLGETVICADEVAREIVEPDRAGAAAVRRSLRSESVCRLRRGLTRDQLSWALFDLHFPSGG